MILGVNTDIIIKNDQLIIKLHMINLVSFVFGTVYSEVKEDLKIMYELSRYYMSFTVESYAIRQKKKDLLLHMD